MGELRQLVFAVGLRGVDRTNKKALEALVLTTLEGLVSQGIPPEEIEGALFSMRFSNQEIRRAGGPFSLVWMRKVLRSWIHGKAPWNTLLFEDTYRALTEKLKAEPRYFESLIERLLLRNPHRCLLSVDPQVGLSEAQEAEIRAELDKLLKELSEPEKQALAEESRRLKEIQESSGPAGSPWPGFLTSPGRTWSRSLNRYPGVSMIWGVSPFSAMSFLQMELYILI